MSQTTDIFNRIISYQIKVVDPTALFDLITLHQEAIIALVNGGGGGGGGSTTAANVTFDHTGTTLTSNNVQAALAELSTNANTISTAVSNAQTTANTANTAAGTAQTTANSASTAASNAQTTANTANSSITTHIADHTNPHQVTATQATFSPGASGLVSTNANAAIVEVAGKIVAAPTVKVISGFSSSNYYIGTEIFTGATQITVAAIYRRINANGSTQRICGNVDGSDRGFALYTGPYIANIGNYDVVSGQFWNAPIAGQDGYSGGVKFHILVGQITVNGSILTQDSVVDGVPTQNNTNQATTAASFPTAAINKFAIGCGGGDPTTGPGVDIEIVACAYRKSALTSFYKEAAQLCLDSQALGYLATPTSGAWTAAYRASDNPGATWSPYVGTDVLTRVGTLTQKTVTNPNWG